MTLDERLEALTQSLELMALRQTDAEKWQIAAEERHTAAEKWQTAAEKWQTTAEERQTAAEERLIAAEERQIAAEERQIAAEERHDRDMEEIRREGRAMRADLRRAFAMGVREARNERRLRHELDEKITQLAAAQLITEEKLQGLYGKMDAFIDSMRRGGNGQMPA